MINTKAQKKATVMFFTLQGGNSSPRGAGDIGNQVSSATGLPVLLQRLKQASSRLLEPDRYRSTALLRSWLPPGISDLFVLGSSSKNGERACRGKQCFHDCEASSFIGAAVEIPFSTYFRFS